MSERIIEVLRQLDHDDDSQWTKNGAPKNKLVDKLVGEDVTIQQVKDAAPEFARHNPVLPNGGADTDVAVDSGVDADGQVAEDTVVDEDEVTSDPMLTEYTYTESIQAARIVGVEIATSGAALHLEGNENPVRVDDVFVRAFKPRSGDIYFIDGDGDAQAQEAEQLVIFGVPQDDDC